MSAKGNPLGETVEKDGVADDAYHRMPETVDADVVWNYLRVTTIPL